ncbi:MAG: DNA polymerase II large subunit [Candidatus Micrarchaeota archaeon]|nr:DNA polymerase II large subunit [Candidatus Micrarchaeota archaeon]
MTHQEYIAEIKAKFAQSYDISRQARQKSKDPSREVEIIPAEDVASRVEGLVGPSGIAVHIRELMKTSKDRENVVLQIADEILEGKWDAKTLCNATDEREVKIEQAVRTGLALYTEGVVSAPIEGVIRLKLKKNADGSEYLSVYFSGPIRGAGGTGQAFTLLLADYCRVKMGVSNYRPLEVEVNRYVEEINLYSVKTRAGQYTPTEDEVRHIVRNCAVCIDGEPTEEYEVNVNKNVRNVESNRVRGGAVLVMSEGVCLKAAKIMKIWKKIPGIEWNWVEKLVKVTKTAAKLEIKPNDKYLKDIVAGRPIFAYPSRKGAFTLRYGRTRLTGIAAKAIHPATMAVLQDFPAIGTQVKIERPGKACIVTPCESIDGPFVKLKNGDVIRVKTLEQAHAIRGEVEKIVFLGDILINYGDFAKANHPLVASSWCSEWYAEELREKGVEKTKEECEEISFQEALQHSEKHGVSLAPRFTLFWSDFTTVEILELGKWIAEKGTLTQNETLTENVLSIQLNNEKKETLENLGLEHKVVDGKITVNEIDTAALLFPLGMLTQVDAVKLNAAKLDATKLESNYSEDKTTLELLKATCGVEIANRAGTYIGASMGRPEKSKERRMQPPVHGLFPLGSYAGKTRSIAKAVKELKNKGERIIQVEVSIRLCPSCKSKTPLPQCTSCSKSTILARQCTECGSLCVSEKCPRCKKPAKEAEKQAIDLLSMYEAGVKTTGFDDAKGVIGLISSRKTYEVIEKALLRAKHDVYVFRDGTCRIDATEIPITHFIPAEIGTSVEKLIELGYYTDNDGKPLTSENQVVELKPQDIIINKTSGEYAVHVANFVDDLLVYLYGLPAFYNAKKMEDLVGQLTICIAPHISAGITTRIIGFTTARALLAHPYVHCATRRNCDGDELAYMLLVDALINFSREFLPATRGGKMDAPLVLSSVLNPSEVDDEVHAMDVCEKYPLEFYRACIRNASATEIKVDTVASRLGTPRESEGLKYTHAAALQGPVETAYVTLGNMREKVATELKMMQSIRAVDAAGAAERIISSHFFPDLYGNLRSFGRQIFRCVDCNEKFRRVPLRGKCARCAGKIILTINKGGIQKYLELSKQMVAEFQLPNYLKQRLLLIERDIASLFEDDKSKQFSLAEYV